MELNLYEQEILFIQTADSEEDEEEGAKEGLHTPARI